MKESEQLASELKFRKEARDASAEQIAKVRALYERPGTPGEKQAAAEALKRMGAAVSPEKKPEPAPARSSVTYTYSAKKENHAWRVSRYPGSSVAYVSEQDADSAAEAIAFAKKPSFYWATSAY